MMRLKYLRKEMRSTAYSLDIKFSYVFILMYAYHSEIFTNKEVGIHVPFGCETISNGIRKLKSTNLIQMIRGGGGKNKKKATYSITGRGKMEIKKLYNKL